MRSADFADNNPIEGSTSPEECLAPEGDNSFPAGELFSRKFDSACRDTAERLLFPGGAQLNWRETVAFEASYGAGAYDRDGRARLTTLGKPLSLVEHVHFLRVKDAQASLPLAIFPETKGVLLPFVGSFWRQDGPISDEALEQAGLSWLRDSEGELVQYPMFASTARSLLLFGAINLEVVAVDGRPRIITGPEEMLDVYNRLNPAWREELLQIAEMAVEREREAAAAQPGEFESTRRAQAIMLGGLKLLHAIEAPFVAERLQFETLRACAIQFKGAGCLSYGGHHLNASAGEVSALPNTQLISEKPEGGCFVVDPRFRGSEGILLWLPHQQSFGVPLGGAPMEEACASAREQAIFERGGKLACVTLGMVKLLDRNNVPELSCSEIGVAVIAVLDDTRRFDVFLEERVPLDERSDFYKAFCVEKYGPQGSEAADERQFVETHFQDCREKHLRELFDGLGRMVRGVLEAGLTNPKHQNLPGNINVCGGIADTRDLIVMRDPNHAIGLILPLMAGLKEFGLVAGFEDGGIFRDASFHRMLRLMLDADAGPIIGFTASPHFRCGTRFGDGVQLIKLAGLITDAWVRRLGGAPSGAYHIADADLVDLLASSPETRRASGIDQRTLRTFQRHLDAPRVVTINRFDGRVTLEDALEPFRANLEHRIELVPTLTESEAQQRPTEQ